MKVGLILPYFGELPNYFNLFLNSCENNKKIDWYIFTDNEIISNSNNIIVKKTTLSEFSEKIEEKLHLRIGHIEPYKLCDFKPTYGKVFQELLKDYDFWGYCDADMIFGDISKFLGNDILLKHDLIQYLGHLTLIRNRDDCNNIYNECKSVPFPHIAKSKVVFGFDEYAVPALMYDHGKRIYTDNRAIADILPFKDELELVHGMNYENQVFEYNDGKIFMYYINQDGKIKKEEKMYIHLQKRKMKIKNVNDKFLITHDSFINQNPKVYLENQLIKNNVILSKHFKFYIKRLNARFKKVMNLLKDGNLLTFLKFRRNTKNQVKTIDEMERKRYDSWNN